MQDVIVANGSAPVAGVSFCNSTTIDVMGTAQVQGELWGANPKAAQAQEAMAKPLWEKMLSKGVGPGMYVLDAGCGTGQLLEMARRKGARVAGYDASRALLEIAKKKNPGGTFDDGDLERMQFDDGEFDMVLSANALQYVGNPLSAVRELARVKKRPGKLVLGMWAEPSKNQIEIVWKQVRPLAPPPLGLPDLAEKANLLQLLKDGGLEVQGEEELEIAFDYPDEQTYLTNLRAFGLVEAAVRQSGESRVTQALKDAASMYRSRTGSIRFINRMRVVVAR